MENEANPYQSPLADAEMRPVAVPKRRSRLLWLVLPTLVGAVLGALLLPGGYPTQFAGRSIAGGFGGFLGLAIGFLLRLMYPLWDNMSPEE